MSIQFFYKYIIYTIVYIFYDTCIINNKICNLKERKEFTSI